MEEEKPIQEIQIGEPTRIPTPRPPQQFSTPAAIIVAGVIVALAVVFTHMPAKTPTAAPAGQAPSANPSLGAQPAAPAVNVKDVVTNGEPYVGNPSAPVVLAYWSDYQCPYCKMFETQVLPQIMQNYVVSGKVRIVFKDFQFLGNDSDTAALNARAIWDLYPAQYFAWRTAMFAAQDAEGDKGFGDQTSITKLTKTISGIDTTKVAAAIAKNKTAYQAAIDADKAEAGNFGIQGTPAFVTGTQLITGADPYTTFSAAFDSQLK